MVVGVLVAADPRMPANAVSALAVVIGLVFAAVLAWWTPAWRSSSRTTTTRLRSTPRAATAAKSWPTGSLRPTTRSSPPASPTGCGPTSSAWGSSSYFLTTFGRSPRETVCAAEVRTEPTLSQALHLLNSPEFVFNH